MSVKVYINSFAALTHQGIHTPAGLKPWEDGQCGPGDVRRPQVINRPYPAFGKLMLPDRLAFSVSSLLVSHYDGTLDERTGVCMEIPFGSLSTDLRYNESVAKGFPSPALFAATLPSSPVSEITIFHKFKGPNRVFAGKSTGGVSALEAASYLIAFGKAANVVVVHVTALAETDRSSPHVDKFAPPAAYAFLLSRIQGHSLHISCELGLRGSADTAFPMDGVDYFEALLDAVSRRINHTLAVQCRGYAGTIRLGEG